MKQHVAWGYDEVARQYHVLAQTDEAEDAFQTDCIFVLNAPRSPGMDAIVGGFTAALDRYFAARQQPEPFLSKIREVARECS